MSLSSRRSRIIVAEQSREEKCAALLNVVSAARKERYWSVPQEWPGEPVFIIGGGTSVQTQDLALLKGRRIIVINSSYQRVLGLTPPPHLPHADYLFFGDYDWWEKHQDKVHSFDGRMITTSKLARTKNRALKLRNSKPPTRPKLFLPLTLSDDRSAVPMRKTSFSAAINIAFLLNGGAPIVLLGADGRLGADNRSHHHVPHERWEYKDARWPRHYEDLLQIVAALKVRNVTVINASPGTAWENLCPVMSLPEAIAVVESSPAVKAA